MTPRRGWSLSGIGVSGVRNCQSSMLPPSSATKHILAAASGPNTSSISGPRRSDGTVSGRAPSASR